jgi:pimeloyl-ACP methyl ester carboxylesterase
MTSTTTRTVTSKDGTVIAFDRYGTGPALVLVDGATAVRAFDVQLATVLAPHFSVYAYDRRGRGDSGDTPPYAVEREIEDLTAVIEAAGGTAFALGHSSGAVLALRAAAAGAPIVKLAVYEPPFIVDGSRPPLPGDYVARLDALVAEGRRLDAWIHFMTAAVGLPHEMAEGMRGEPWVGAMEAVAHTIAYDGRVMGDTMSGTPLSPGPWGRIAIPVLVMDGSASPTHMHTGADALAAHLPHAERRTLVGQDHGPADDVLAPELVKFFST